MARGSSGFAARTSSKSTRASSLRPAQESTSARSIAEIGRSRRRLRDAARTARAPPGRRRATRVPAQVTAAAPSTPGLRRAASDRARSPRPSLTRSRAAHPRARVVPSARASAAWRRRPVHRARRAPARATRRVGSRAASGRSGDRLDRVRIVLVGRRRHRLEREARRRPLPRPGALSRRSITFGASVGPVATSSTSARCLVTRRIASSKRSSWSAASRKRSRLRASGASTRTSDETNPWRSPKLHARASRSRKSGASSRREAETVPKSASASWLSKRRSPSRRRRSSVSTLCSSSNRFTGLRQEVGGAEDQRAESVARRLDPARRDQHRYVDVRAAQRTEQLVAGDARHDEIEDHEIGPVRDDLRERLEAVDCLASRRSAASATR